MKKRPPYADPVKELKAKTREIRAENAQRRSALFNASFSSVGSILSTMRGSNLASAHPHRCKCQDVSGEKDPHKHYPEPPFSCARCSECDAYEPAVPEEIPDGLCDTRPAR